MDICTSEITVHTTPQPVLSHVAGTSRDGAKQAIYFEHIALSSKKIILPKFESPVVNPAAKLKFKAGSRLVRVDKSIQSEDVEVFEEQEQDQKLCNVTEMSESDLAYVGRKSQYSQTDAYPNYNPKPKFITVDKIKQESHIECEVEIMFGEDAVLSNQAKDTIVNVYEYLRIQGFPDAVQQTVNATRVHLKLVEALLTEVGYLGPDINPQCSHGSLPKDATTAWCPCLLLVAKRRFETPKKSGHTWTSVITTEMEERIHAIWLELWGRLNRQPFVYEVRDEGIKDMPELKFGLNSWQTQLWNLRMKWGEVDEDTPVPSAKKKRFCN